MVHGPGARRGILPARVAGFSRLGDQARDLSEEHACKTTHDMYMLICMGQAINARST